LDGGENVRNSKIQKIYNIPIHDKGNEQQYNNNNNRIKCEATGK